MTDAAWKYLRAGRTGTVPCGTAFIWELSMDMELSVSMTDCTKDTSFEVVELTEIELETVVGGTVIRPGPAPKCVVRQPPGAITR
jgi:hypothetical protein